MIEQQKNQPNRSIPLLVLSGAGLLFFSFLLLAQLPARPMHNDEAVNVWFMERLIQSNSYRYDPQNYHGPTLYYIQMALSWVNAFLSNPAQFSFDSTAGVTPTSVRVGVALAAILTLILLLCSTHRLGLWGAFSAFMALGQSCGFLFYARYFIHETFFVLFTLGVYLGFTYYADTKKRLFLTAGWISAMLLYATKETSVLVIAVLVLAALCTEITSIVMNRFNHRPITRYRWRRPVVLLRQIGQNSHIGIAAALVIWLCLYTSFFTNWKGLYDSVATYLTWTKTGVESGHNKPFGYFIREILFRYEKPLLFLSLIGATAAFVLKNKNGLFFFYWTLGITLLHSLIPYKTPWLVLNILLPMALLSGHGIQALVTQFQTSQNPRAILMAIASVLFATLFFAGRQFPETARILFVEYDNEQHKHVYVHTSRDIYRLLEDIDTVVELNQLGSEVPINIVSPTEWPLPFYLRKYPNAYFWRTFKGISHLDTPLIIAQSDQQNDLLQILQHRYTLRRYVMRPGVELDLYVFSELRRE